MTAVIIKFCSGEEVFATLIGVDEDRITILEPMKVSRVYVESTDGVKIQLNYEPYLDYMGLKEHTFSRQHVMSCAPLHSRLSQIYKAMIDASTILPEDFSNIENLKEGNITIH